MMVLHQLIYYTTLLATCLSFIDRKSNNFIVGTNTNKAYLIDIETKKAI